MDFDPCCRDHAAMLQGAGTMSEVVELLLRDFLLWLNQQGRPYDDVMDAWRTSCPRLPVWEEANERGFLTRRRTAGEVMIAVSPTGRDFLAGSP
jgi:D-3-phosphoglycerate dehydrogenase